MKTVLKKKTLVRALALARACSLILLLFSCAPAMAGSEAALRLIKAYPEAGMALEKGEGGVFIRVQGFRLLFEPTGGCPPPRPDMDADQPLCASMAQAYPAGPGGRLPEPGFDPGRTRNEALLRLLYGASAEEVRQHCAEISFLGQSLLFTTRHGAAEALSRAAKRLEEAAAANPALMRYILPSPGAFCWRYIEGGERLSAHSFGIALDLNVARGPYWRWASPSSPAVRKARDEYPQAVVDAFEAEGFIWGGKWSRFDFMHFEYRPELLQPEQREKARLTAPAAKAAP